MPRTTSAEKMPPDRVPRRPVPLRGRPAHDVRGVRRASRRETGGHYMDQFTYAERATDWRGNNNIAESIYQQLGWSGIPEPAWIVATAGTGGTSATIARYVHYMQHDTRICVADPENSCFFEGWTTGDPDVTCDCGSRIEGIGRPRMEPSFVPGAIDRMMKVPDAASVAAVRALERAIGRKAGGSTGTGLWSALKIVAEMVAEGRTGQRGHAAVRPGRPLPRQVLLGRVAGRAGPGHRAVHRRRSTRFWRRASGRPAADRPPLSGGPAAVTAARARPGSQACAPAAGPGAGPRRGRPAPAPAGRAAATRPGTAAVPSAANVHRTRVPVPGGRQPPLLDQGASPGSVGDVHAVGVHAPAPSPRGPSPGNACRPGAGSRAPRRPSVGRASVTAGEPLAPSPTRPRRAPGDTASGGADDLAARTPAAAERSRRSRAPPDAVGEPWANPRWPSTRAASP